MTQAIQMILDGQCGQFNSLLLKCLKELSLQLSKMSGKEMDDNKYSHEIQRLSNEILRDKSLPNQIYSQNLVKVMQEKIDFFKSNSGMNSIDYNAVSGQLTILNGKQQILCQRDDPKFNLFKEFGVIEEDVQYIRDLLHQTSVQNKEISVQIKATVENDSQMYKLKLHTLWSPMKKDVYAIMLASANDVALQIAEQIGGSVDGFVQMMNNRAVELGCTNTVFTNPTGLPDENQHTTAHDMALITKAAIDNESFRAIAETTSYTIPATNVSGGERVLTNNFSMLNNTNASYYQYCLGGREGYTEASGSTLVCGAEKTEFL